ncbi:hypothetical protein ACIBO5_29710 [Nonomuraea angiospora]|uniref:hypothetical protein n=1 Tax=Nonomuraea angiospora TaxID=46172 RepID=UPI00379D2B15
MELISRSLGREITYRQVPVGAFELDPDAERALADERAFPDERGPWHADRAALRERHPGLLDSRTWLRDGDAERTGALLT